MSLYYEMQHLKLVDFVVFVLNIAIVMLIRSVMLVT